MHSTTQTPRRPEQQTVLQSPLSQSPSLFDDDLDTGAKSDQTSPSSVNNKPENISPIDINSRLNITDWLIGSILFVGADLTLSAVYGMGSHQFVIIHSLMGLSAAGMGFFYMSRRSQMSIIIPAFASPLLIQVCQSLMAYITTLNTPS